MIIGEAPGAREDELGKPFQGRSGAKLKEWLDEAGLDWRDVYITNVVKCRPPENRDPEADEIKACREFLDAEFSRIRPTHVLLLGRIPLKLAGKSKITEVRGSVIVKDGITFFPTFHPAYVLRNPGMESVVKSDFENFARLVRGEEILKTDEVQWEELNHDNFDDFTREYDESEAFSFDLETTGLDWWKPGERVNLLTLGLAKRSWVIPLSLGYWCGDYAPPGASPIRNDLGLQRDLVRWIVAKQGDRWSYGQNAKFDNLWLMHHYGVKFRLDFDDKLASHILDENRPNNLKYMVKTLLGGPDYDLPLKEKLGLVPSAWPKLKRYAAEDGVFTRQLGEMFYKELNRQPTLERLFYELIMPAARVFEDVELEGMYVDVERKSRFGRRLQREKDTLETKMNEEVGHTVNWNSPQQVGKAFFEEMNMPVTQMTAKGKPSTSESAILDLKDKYPIAAKLAKLRELEKYLSTYINGWDALRDGDFVYFGYKLDGTVTGRYSSRLHQVPRDAEVRSLITAPEGWSFVAADYSQIELRIVAQLSQDPTMVHVFASGGDIHSHTASLIAGKNVEDLTKEERKMAKAINFGLIYGMGWKKLMVYAWEKYGVRLTPQQAKTFRRRFFEMYDGLLKWHDRQRRIVRSRGYVRTLTGRMRHLPNINSGDESARAEAERLGINSPVQGFGSELKSMAMVELHETFRNRRDEFRLKGEHHDAILMWVKTASLGRILPHVKNIMENPKLLNTFEIDMSVPLIAEIEVGPWNKGVKWGET